MKRSKDSLSKQRKILDERLASIAITKSQPGPKSGWLRAIRESLGLSSELLSRRLGVAASYILKLEKREQSGTASLATLAKAAEAMDCKLVYFIVPAHDSSLDAIIDKRCLMRAKALQKSVDQTMSLENQATSRSHQEAQIKELAQELKSNLDPKIWEDK